MTIPVRSIRVIELKTYKITQISLFVILDDLKYVTVLQLNGLNKKFNQVPRSLCFWAMLANFKLYDFNRFKINSVGIRP